MSQNFNEHNDPPIQIFYKQSEGKATAEFKRFWLLPRIEYCWINETWCRYRFIAIGWLWWSWEFDL